MSTHGASGDWFAAGMVHAVSSVESLARKRTSRWPSCSSGGGGSTRLGPGTYRRRRSNTHTDAVASTYAVKAIATTRVAKRFTRPPGVGRAMPDSADRPLGGFVGFGNRCVDALPARTASLRWRVGRRVLGFIGSGG